MGENTQPEGKTSEKSITIPVAGFPTCEEYSQACNVAMLRIVRRLMELDELSEDERLAVAILSGLVLEVERSATSDPAVIQH
jgi:hypothetical protein